MATVINLRDTKTAPSAYPQGNYRDALVTKGSGLKQQPTTATTLPNGEREFTNSATPFEPLQGWFSERASAQFTLSGTITFNIWGSCTAGFTGLIRVRVYKVTVGGSNIETFIAQADSPQLTTTSTKYTFTATPASTVISQDERLIIRLTAAPISGSFGTAGTTATLQYDGASGVRDSNMTLTETVTLNPNTTKLYLQGSTGTGIGSFMDVIPTLTVQNLSAIVNTVANGTSIQWTKTAGGAVAEWISPRFKRGWLVDAINYFSGGQMLAHESSLSANCAWSCKIWKRTPAGVETLVYSVANAAELTTADTGQFMTGGTLAQTTAFAEDDRLVVRCYIVNVGTMAGGFTCTLTYAASNTWLLLLEPPPFKAESDPAGTSSITSGLAMGGVGN